MFLMTLYYSLTRVYPSTNRIPNKIKLSAKSKKLHKEDEKLPGRSRNCEHMARKLAISTVVVDLVPYADTPTVSLAVLSTGSEFGA